MKSLRKKIAQMLIMGFDGVELNDTSPVAQWLTQDGLGGVLLFDKNLHDGSYDKNLKTQAQIKGLLHQLNHYANASEQQDSLPLLTAIDYEGGAVDRLSKVDGCIATLKASEMALLEEDARQDVFTDMAITLKSLGFNLNFAPVVDLNLNEHEGIIGALGRSFSSDPAQVIRMAGQFVEIFSRHGIACAYKHFPGHGSAVGDTHEGFVDVTDTFESQELTPYYKLLQDNKKPVMIMTAHVINKHLDSDGIPATLSYKVLSGLLRQTIGYEGVIVSDDLQMQAISDHYSLEDSLRMTINAGADMLIFGNQLGRHTAPEVIDCIMQLLISGAVSQERIDEAYMRIMLLKKQVLSVELVDSSVVH